MHSYMSHIAILIFIVYLYLLYSRALRCLIICVVYCFLSMWLNVYNAISQFSTTVTQNPIKMQHLFKSQISYKFYQKCLYKIADAALKLFILKLLYKHAFVMSMNFFINENTTDFWLCLPTVYLKKLKLSLCYIC